MPSSREIAEQFAAEVDAALLPGEVQHPAVEAVVLSCATGFAQYLTLRVRGDAEDAVQGLVRARSAPLSAPPLRVPYEAKSVASLRPRELSELTTTLLEHIYCIVDVTLARAARIPEAAPG